MPIVDPFHQRDDVDFIVTVYDDDSQQSLLDVSGAVSLVARLGLAGAVQTSVEFVGVVNDGPAGELRYSLSSALSELLVPGTYDFQAEATLNGSRRTIVGARVPCLAALPDIL